MIDKFYIDDVEIIPKIKRLNEISLNQGDTLVAFLDTNYYTLDNIQSIY